MKRVILGALALICLASCSYRVYPVDMLAENYKLAMQTPEEIAAKESVAIFLSETEVPGPYKLIAFVENRPILPVAIASQQAKNFFKQAVLKADELGGNAIIVNSIRSFKVLQLPGGPVRKAPREVQPEPKPQPAPRFIPKEKEQPEPRVQREPREPREPRGQFEFGKLVDKVKSAPIFQKKEQSAETPAVETKPVETKPTENKTVVTKAPETKVAEATPASSPVFDDNTLQWFTSGYVYRAKEEEQVEIIDAMNDEIRNNLKVCKTQAEADFITKKIDQLEKYNNTLPIPSGTQASKIKAFRNMLKKLAAKF